MGGAKTNPRGVLVSLMSQRQKHFIDLSQLNVDVIRGLLLKAIFFAQNPPLIKKYEGKRFLFYFQEPSTRTSLSFKLAASNLGIEVLEINEESSSFKKGEDFHDALKVFEAMGFDGLLVRTSEESLLHDHQEHTALSLVNAGSGCQYHPSQALLDLATINEQFQRTTGLKIAIVGDVAHSRVANSHIRLHEKLGNEVLLYSDQGSSVSWEQIQEEADVVIMLRVQFERHQKEFSDKGKYLETHGLTPKRFKSLKQNAIVMHPGPFNRDVEISSEIINEENVKIFNQVKWGIPARMAIFDYILGERR